MLQFEYTIDSLHLRGLSASSIFKLFFRGLQEFSAIYPRYFRSARDVCMFMGLEIDIIIKLATAILSKAHLVYD
jgi:hypothetical protein